MVHVFPHGVHYVQVGASKSPDIDITVLLVVQSHSNLNNFRKHVAAIVRFRSLFKMKLLYCNILKHP